MAQKCLKCAEEISTKATRCPSCGYEPKKVYEDEAEMIQAYAILFSLTIIGIIPAIPMWKYARKYEKEAQGMKPTNTKPD